MAFQPGQSGNPAGRPPGARSTVAALRKELISDADLQAIVDMVIAKALDGDLTAAGMIMDRRLPKLRVSAEVHCDADDLAQKLEAARIRAGLDRHHVLPSLESAVMASIAIGLVPDSKVIAMAVPREVPLVHSAPAPEKPAKPAALEPEPVNDEPPPRRYTLADFAKQLPQTYDPYEGI